MCVCLLHFKNSVLFSKRNDAFSGVLESAVWHMV